MTKRNDSRDSTENRQTATFEPYYWEAYNEIVKPSRFDWYLVTRWLPDLGALGFALVKALRTRCYHNPRTGITRNQVEIDMKELAASVGVSPATLYREIERNTALGRFVQVQHQYAATDGMKAPKRFKPEFTICMDDPIHETDREHYELLRAQKEAHRIAAQRGEVEPPARFRVKPLAGQTPGSGQPQRGESGRSGPKSQIENKGDLPKSQIEIYGVPKSQFENEEGGTKSQIENPQSQFETDAPYYNPIPSGGFFTKEVSYTPSAAPPSHKCEPPEGEIGRAEDTANPVLFDPMDILWNVTLSLLQTRMSVPALHTHLKSLRLDGIEEDRAIVKAASPFTREWIEKRYAAIIEDALAEAAGKPLRLVLSLEER